MTQILLCSESPRRKEILSAFSLPFQQIASNYDETAVDYLGNSAEYVMQLAQNKAKSLRQRFPDALLIAADTTVECAGQIYNKPQSLEEARAMLKSLKGRKHHVYTGLSLSRGDQWESGHEVTHVELNALDDLQLESYLQSGAWKGKAGAYAIQGIGGLLVKAIQGCYYNVMGLPINLLQSLLSQFEISLWHHLRRN